MRHPYPALLAVLLALSPVACNSGGDGSTPVGQAGGAPLVTAEGTVVGKVTVANSESNLIITVASESGWLLKKLRIALGTDLKHIPQTSKGEPITGRFPIRSWESHDFDVKEWRFPLVVEPGTLLFFAVQADVRKQAPKDDPKTAGSSHDDDDHDCVVESAWGQGLAFPKGKGAMYFTYTVQKDLPPNLAGMYRTHTQDEWGGDPLVGKAAGYLQTNFPATFPTGATIGMSSGFTARFTTSDAVGAFLPQSGPAGSLGKNWVNPVTMGNSLAGHTLALSLTVGFDAKFKDFAPGTVQLQNLKVANPSSPFFGMTVAEVLAMADQILSGQADDVFTADQANEAVQQINLNFQGGTIDLGFLALP